MPRTLYNSLLLLALTATTVAIAQPAPPRITSDSLAMFTIAEDALKPGREIVRQHGFVSHVSVTPAGEVSVNIFRQHHAYLTTQKGMGLKPGVNTIPALLRATYRQGAFGPAQDTYLSLASGLQKPFTFRAENISSFTGGIKVDGLLADQSNATDLNTLLTQTPEAIGYRGDVFTRTDIGIIGPNLVILREPYQFVPFAARYIPYGKASQQAINQVNQRTNLVHWPLNAQGHISYYHPINRSLVTIDTTGKVINTLPVSFSTTPDLVTSNEVIGPLPQGIVTPGGLQPVIGVDWLFGPVRKNGLRSEKDPEFLLIRTDTDGKEVFRQSLKFSYEDYGFGGAQLVSDASGSVVSITLAKGLLKYQIGYARVSVQGGVPSVAWQRVWDKKDPKRIGVNGNPGPFIGFQGITRLVSLPDGQSLLLNREATNDRFEGYGALLLSNTGEMVHYYSIRPSQPPGLAAEPTLYVLPLSDGRVMLLANEARNASGGFAPFGELDMELADGYTGGPVVAGQKSLLVNATTGVPKFLPNTPAANAPSSGGGIGLVRGLSLLAGGSALGGGSDANDKHRYNIDSSPVNYAPMVYLLEPAQGRAVVRDMGRGGYGFPNLPMVYLNPGLNEAYFPLRTLPQPTERVRSARYPMAVYFKLVKLNW